MGKQLEARCTASLPDPEGVYMNQWHYCITLAQLIGAILGFGLSGPCLYLLGFYDAINRSAKIAARSIAEQKIINAAVAFAATEEAQSDYDLLKGSNSASLPVEYINLIEAVRESAEKKERGEF